MREIRLLLIFLLIVPIGLASTPRFNFNPILTRDVINGEVDLGDLLFIEQPYESEIYTRQTISAFSLQRYDVMVWQGSESIKVRNPLNQDTILVNGSQYYFPNDGLYQMISMINSSNTAYITSLPADPINVNISVRNVPFGMFLNFSESDFVLTTEKSVSATLLVEEDVKKGDYVLDYVINNEPKTHTIKVLENINWTLDDDNFTKNITIKNGENKYLGRLELTNFGNVDLEITTTKTGNQTHLIGLPQPQKLYRKNQVFLDFQAQIPSTQMPGDYDLMIHIKGGDLIKNVSLEINVVDSIVPIIESVNFSTDKVFQPNKITITATDNIGVKDVTLFFDDKNIKMKKDGNLFSESYVFDKLSKYEMQVCAEDNDKNKVCETFNKTFSKLNVFEGNQKVITMPSMKSGKYSRNFLINLTENVPEGVVLQLVSFSGNEESNSLGIVRVIDKDGFIKQFTEYVNDVTLTDKGEYTLEVRMDKVGDFEGIIRYDAPEYVQGIQDTTFRVSFKDYDVPVDFTQSWIDGRDFICKVIDTGNLDTSHYKCEIEYPISLKAGSLSIPTTAEERERFKQEADKVREEMSEMKKKNAWIISLLILIPIVLLLWGLYMVFLYPTHRIIFREGRK